MSYRVYGYHYRNGYEFICNEKDLIKAKADGKGLNPKEYEKYMIIECEKNGEFPVVVEELPRIDFKSRYRVNVSARKEKPEEKSKIYRKMKNYIEEQER